MNIENYMKQNVIPIPVSATIQDAAYFYLYARHRIGTLPVVDE